MNNVENNDTFNNSFSSNKIKSAYKLKNYKSNKAIRRICIF